MTPYYQDDAVQIFHGDCREILPQLQPVDLVLTDPPYGHGEKWSGGTWAANPIYQDCFRWDAVRPTDDDLVLVVGMAPTSIIWGGNYFGLPPSRCWLGWEKSSKMDTLADFELAWTNMDRPSKLFEEDRNPDGKRYHPTQKPLSLFSWCLIMAGNKQAIIDPYMGSGTTLRAAKDLGRKAIGIEIEEKYCEIAAKRMSQEVLDFQGQKGIG